ncbi:hypothetical protein [Kineosporia sp. A_224]|uniref:hypothetical protein n=1 Tax=Kineosporia sp. A_224 TaxID=1962180 RepID=UPI000B4B945D|nr:hypothetical protein [Kineosporia sp. A_224]
MTDASPTIVLLTEQALTPGDAARITAFHADDSPAYRVVVPADTERSLLVDVLDHLSLLELREALDAVRGRDDDAGDRAAAGQALAATLAELKAVGVEATGEVVAGDPVDTLAAQIATTGATEVVVVTRLHAVEDTFHTDWASRARERLGVPVLHVYAGSSWVG